MSNISDYYQKLGGAGSPLGAVVGTETSAPWGGLTQKYQRGQIFFHTETGAHALTGGALDALVAAGGVAELGYPLEDATTTADGQVAYFERGCVLSATGDTFVCRLVAPLIGRPAMVDPAKPILEVAVITKPRTIAAKAFTTLWENRLFLQAVGNTTPELPLVIQGTPNRGAATFGFAPGATLPDRQLYNLTFRRSDGTNVSISPHAFYVKQSWDNFGLIHATDLHVARRVESYRQKLLDGGQPEGAGLLESTNDRFRDMICAANALHQAGSLDAIVMTGDLIDFDFEADDRADGLGNYKVFRELLLGRGSSPDSTVKTEELKVPVFTILGNHDYRKNPYQLFANATIAGGTAFNINQYTGFNLIEEDAFVIQGRREPEIPAMIALKMVQVDKKQDPYLRFINDRRSYVVALGQNRLVMLDTRYDAGLPDVLTSDDPGIGDVLNNVLKGINREDAMQLIAGSPNVLGVQNTDLRILKKALSETVNGGAVIVGVHGPPFDVAGAEYPWFFRETLRNRPEVASEMIGFVRRHDKRLLLKSDEGVTKIDGDWVPSLGVQPANFKSGNITNLIDVGASRGPNEEFLKLCAGEGSARAADIILCGHGHKHTEYRVKRNKGQFLLFMDFYSENPPHYYNTRSADGRSIFIDVAPGGDMKPVTKAWEVDFAEYSKMVTPPYANPLSATTNSQQAKTWWNQHRPIVMQTSSLGQVENRQRVVFTDDSEPIKPGPTFQGYRIMTIKDNVISRIQHVGQAPNRKLKGWGKRTVTRLADTGSAASKIDEVKLLQLDATRLLTATRADDGHLLLISWAAKLGIGEPGTLTRTGDSARLAGKASNLGAVQAGEFVVTSCRNDDGDLLLISWRVAANGAITRAKDSGSLAGEAHRIQIVALSSSLLVTACQNGDGNLLLISWRLGADGSFTRLNQGSAGEISALAMVSPVSGKVVTAVRAGNDRLLLISWSVGPDGAIRRLADTGEQAGEIESNSGISACVDSFGRVVTTVRADDRLKVLLWEVAANGQMIRRGDGTGQAGKVGQHTITPVSSTGDRSILVSAVTTEDGGLKLITWDVTREGAIRRVAQTGGEAGESSSLSVAAGPFAAGISPSFPIVTALRAGNGNLLMISWRATSSGRSLNLPQGQVVVNHLVNGTATQLSRVRALKKTIKRP